MRIGSLCTGYGGLDAAIEEVIGGELAWVADIDPGACKILERRFPGVPNLGDITTTDWTAVQPVDILAGGYPCQPFSDAGNRKGTDDERHIWPYFATAIRVLRPRIVVLENVRGHLGRGFDVVLADLAALGFDAEWVTVPASGVGACHQRQRVFVLAWPVADTRSRELQRRRGPGLPGSAPTAESREGDQREWAGDAARYSGAAASEDADGAAGGQRRLAATGQAPGGRPRSDAGRPGGTRPAADALGPGLEVRGVEHHGPQRPAAERGSRELAAADSASDGRSEGRPEPARIIRGPDAVVSGGAAPEWAADEFWTRPGAFKRYEAAVRRHESALGRRAPAPVEPGRTGNPRLAARFPEWMMGLPDGWVTGVPGLSRNDQLHAIGNGVMPLQAAAALRLLLDRSGLLPLVAADLTSAEGGEAA